jgi:uncharacterized membrane protein YfcA
MLVGSAPMSLAGVATATWLKHTYGPSVASIEGTVLGAALAAGGLGLLAKSRMRLRAAPEGPFVLARRDKLAAFAVGSFGGYVVGLTSIGSGVFFALTLLVVFPLRSKKVVGTDIFHAAGLLWIAGIGHLVAGNVDTGAIPWLLAGSVPGVLLGSQLTLGVSDAALLRGVAVVLVLAGVRLLDSAGALWMLVGAVVSGTAVLIALFGRRVAPAFSRLVVASSVVPWASPGSRHSR